MASAENNKTLVRRFLEAHAKGDLDTVEEMLAPISSTTTCFLAKSQTSKATCGHSPSIMLPFPTPATSSRSR
jgi:hypothetical protein